MVAGGNTISTVFVTTQPVPGDVKDIIAGPAEVPPHTIPVVAPTVANDDEVLHVPPVTRLLSVAHILVHIWLAPVMPGGLGYTVTVFTDEQPVEASW